MSTRTLCMIHEAVGDQSAIAKVAMWGVRWALRAGWRVSVVAKELDEKLREEVEWLRLFVPPRLFLLKWVTARRFILSALGGRRFDVIHSHQPQVASISDVFQCQFLTRVAYERRCLESRPGLRPAIVRAQQLGVLHAEDFYYRRWNERTRMLFCSELMRDQFQRLYGMPPREEVLENACPAAQFPGEGERLAARRKLIGDDHAGLVLGYLGGLHERKGYRALLRALEGERDIFLLMGGEHTNGFEAPALRGHFKSIGWVRDKSAFLAACDVFIVPSVFDPWALVASDAAAHGVPVIACSGVGSLPALLRHGAGESWEPGAPLAPLVRGMAAKREFYRAGGQRMAAELSEDRQGARLLRVYDEILAEKRSGN